MDTISPPMEDTTKKEFVDAQEHNGEMKKAGDRFVPEIAGEVIDAYVYFKTHARCSNETAVELTKVYFTAAYMPEYADDGDDAEELEQVSQ